MKRRTPSNGDFRAITQKRYWPIRSIGRLMIVIALSGLMLATVSLRPRGSGSGPRYISRTIPKVIPVQRLARAPLTNVNPSNDRFVILAPPEIDSAMVIRADPHIDPDMVFHLGPDGRWSRGLDVAVPPSWYSPEDIPQTLPQPR